jgi:hypothetical protein
MVFIHTSVRAEMDAHAEAVAVNTVQKCADWLREQGESEMADKLLERFVEEKEPVND